MHELSLATLAVFFLIFLKNSQCSLTGASTAELKHLPNIMNFSVYCCNTLRIFNYTDTVQLNCGKYLWHHCYIEIKAANVQLDKLEVYTEKKKYYVETIKSLQQLRFKYTQESKGENWTLIMNTANSSTANQMGRIYFNTKCEGSFVYTIPLANNFSNFNPGRTDIFEFKAPEFHDANYCVLLMNTLTENWILSSFTLIDHKKINYTFYPGKITQSHKFYGYRNASNSVNWTFTVTTGPIGAGLVDITLINDDCKTRLTLNSRNNDFQPNSTDVFQMQAKDCKGLEKIQIEPHIKNSGWIFIQLNATQEAEQSYVFYHNESLQSMQTFYVNQSTGDIKWNVSVCSNTSTDDEVYLSLYCGNGNAENLRLSTREDDFKTGQCSNFTLFLGDLGKLWKIKIKKTKDFQINRLILYKEKEKYEFYPPISSEENLELAYPKMGISIFIPDIEMAGEKVKECAALCVNDAACQQFSVKDNCNFNPAGTQPKIYKFRDDISVWNLIIILPTLVTQFRVLLIDQNDIKMIINFSNQQQNISTTFSTSAAFFGFPRTVCLEPFSKIICNNVKIQLKKLTAAKLITINLRPAENDHSSRKCSLAACHYYESKHTISTIRETTVPVTTSAKYTSNKEPNNDTTTITPMNTYANNNPTLISHNTDSNNHTTLMPHIDTDPYDNNTTHITYPNLSDILTASNDPVQATDLPDVTMNARLCRCPCPRNLSEEQQAELLKSLTKELKVNRSETSSYIRSKISAPDDRVSSQVIGTAAVAIMVVPFGLIVLIDLIPLLSLIYKKIISFV